MSVNRNNTNDGRDARFCVSTFVFIWFIINLLQAIFTEIHEDEAYYALFGEHLAWGYFDHPPMVGLMTFLSSIFFSGTLGVRFFTIIASCLSLWVMWRIANLDCFVVPPRKSKIRRSQCAKRQLNNAQLSTDSKLSTLNSQLPTDSQLSTLNPKLFFTIAFSIVIINLYGFVTTPDAALLLFSTLFLWVYQRYLNENSWKNTLLMGLLMALMIYSKYHAFLLLSLIVLSNLKLLKDGKFYVACLLALVLLTPHILWQINADFPSLRYHLSQRSEPFRWSYFFEYLPNQLLVFNPFVFGAVVYVIFKHKSMDCFERGLLFVLVGFFTFFWLMTFRGHVEPHWTVIGVIPAIILVYRKALIDYKLQKYIKFIVAPSLLLVLVMRIALLTPLSKSFGFYGKEDHYKAIASVAGTRPVVFQGSFQQPALYHWFTGNESSTLRCFYDRATQYDLWQFDKDWIGKPVFIYGIPKQNYQIGDESFTGYNTDNFQTANRLVTEFQITNIDHAKIPVIHVNDTLDIAFSIHNPCNQTIEFQSEMGLKLLLLDDNEARYGFYEPIATLQPNETHYGHFSVSLDEKTKLGTNRLLLCIGDRIAVFGNVKNAVEVVIE